MKSLAVAVLFLIVVAGALPAAANSTTYTWNFATSPNHSLGTNSHLYLSSGVGITATGSSNLYYKSGGLGETGLGLVCGHHSSCDHEIGHGQSIVFNLGGLLDKNVTGISLTLESLQAGETGSVCDGFGACVTFTAGNNRKSVSILGLFTDMRNHHSGNLIVKAGSGDVLVDQLQVTTSAVPEPGSLFLMGSGLLGIVGVIRRKLIC